MKVLVLSLPVLLLLLSVDIVKSKKQRPCPRNVIADDGLYRNIGEGKTPCRGDISKCIYSRYWFEYCMNGYFGHYHPVRIPPQPFEEKTKSYGGGSLVTTKVGNPNPNNTPFNMSTITDPVTQYTFFPAEFVNRLVVGGFKWSNDIGVEQQPIGDVDGTQLAAPTVIPVAPTNYIVEIYARLGDKIDRLEFVILDSITGVTSSYAVGGLFGTQPIDATPPGNCKMINIAGTTDDTLASLEFTWFCQ